MNRGKYINLFLKLYPYNTVFMEFFSLYPTVFVRHMLQLIKFLRFAAAFILPPFFGSTFLVSCRSFEINLQMIYYVPQQEGVYPKRGFHRGGSCAYDIAK